MSQRNKLTSGDERRLSPLSQYEEVDVVFPDTPHTDLEVPYSNLTPPSPEQIDYQVVRQSQAAAIYHDVSGTRKPWPQGFILLRSNVGGARATLRLSVRNKAFTPVLIPVTNINPPAATNVLLDAANHTDTDATAPVRGDIIVRNNAGKWIVKALGAVGAMLRSDGSDPQWSTDGSSLTSLNASNISSGSLADARLSSNVPLKDTVATITGVYTFSTNPVFNANAIPETAIADGSLLARLAANETIAGLWDFTSGLKERGRSVAIGEWTTVAYNAANFTTSGGGAWTVDSGDQRTFTYMLIGKTMFISLNISDTDVAASPGISLQVAIPGGFTCANQMVLPMLYSDAGATNVWGYVFIAAAGSQMLFRKLDNSNWTATALDNTSLFANFSFEIA